MKQNRQNQFTLTPTPFVLSLSKDCFFFMR